MPKFTNEHVIISFEAQQSLLADVCQRRHIEACGLLLGHIDHAGNWHVEKAHSLRNIYNSPDSFEFAPEDLLEAELTFAGRIIGVYHSHPSGYAAASETDRENMRRVNVEQQIPWAWLIIRGPFHKKYQQLTMMAYHHYSDLGLREIAIDVDRGI